MGESLARAQRRAVRRIVGDGVLERFAEHDHALTHHAEVLRSIADHAQNMSDSQRLKNLDYERRIRALENRPPAWKFWSRW